MKKKEASFFHLSPESRVAVLRAGVRLEIVTITWMTFESVIAIGSGIIAGSVLLIAFGLDSVVELISGIVLLWRLKKETKGGDRVRIEQVEQRATWISAVLLALLSLCVAITAVVGIVRHIEPESSFPGILISMGAMIVMPLLARAKRGINQRLGSAALRADIAESVTCGYMAGTVLVGLVFNATLGLWWGEYVAAAGFLYWLVGETREAFLEARHGLGAD
jgi:divalent metal cation (Fe/Co/Zn/Cd) transporter